MHWRPDTIMDGLRKTLAPKARIYVPHEYVPSLTLYDIEYSLYKVLYSLLYSTLLCTEYVEWGLITTAIGNWLRVYSGCRSLSCVRPDELAAGYPWPWTSFPGTSPADPCFLLLPMTLLCITMYGVSYSVTSGHDRQDSAGRHHRSSTLSICTFTPSGHTHSELSANSM